MFVVEGEKDVDNLRETGATATCNVGGAGKWSDDYTRALAGASEVIVIRDRDEPGAKHAAAVVASVQTAGIPVRVLELARGKDVSDHLAAGLGYEDLLTPDSHPTNPKMAVPSQGTGPGPSSGISGTQILDGGWDEPVSLAAGRRGILMAPVSIPLTHSADRPTRPPATGRVRPSRSLAVLARWANVWMAGAVSCCSGILDSVSGLDTQNATPPG